METIFQATLEDNQEQTDTHSILADADLGIVGKSVNLNLCSGCGRNFSGVKVHERHRVGGFKRGQRRCLSPEEMLAIGFTMAIEPVKRYVEGKPTHVQMETWHLPIDEKEKARLAKMREKGKRKGE